MNLLFATIVIFLQRNTKHIFKFITKLRIYNPSQHRKLPYQTLFYLCFENMLCLYQTTTNNQNLSLVK